MSAHLTERTTKAFRLSFIAALLTLLALSAAPPAKVLGAPKAWSTVGSPSTARRVHTRVLLPAHEPGIWIKTGGVNEITPALTEGTVTPHDDEASEFVHQIQQWGTFGSQSFATAQEALDWVHGNIAYGEDQANYGVPEAWANPEQTLSQRSGDCEDQAFLLASLLKWHTAEVKTGEGDLVLANCGFVLPPDGAFHCWVIWYDASDADWHQLDPTSGLMNGILYPALGTLWLDDARVFGFLHEYYPGPLPVVGGYDREDFARIAAGGFGDPMNNYPWSMAQFHGDLYVGTGRNVPWLVERVLRTIGMVPAGLELFTGITRPREPVGSREWAEDMRGEIWRYRDGSWEQVYRSGIVTHPLTGQWVPEENGFRRMIVFTDAAGEQAIYAANSAVLPQVCTNSLLMKSTDGATWQRVVTPPAMGCDSRAMTIHNGKLYVATGLGGRAQVWATDRPSTVADNWDLVADFTNHDPTNSNVTSLASFNGYLYAGTQDFVTGFQVFRSNARSPAGPVLGGWTRIIRHGAGDMMNYWAGTMTVFKNHLYLGTMTWPINFLSGELAVPKGFELLRIRSNDSWELLIGEYVPRMPPPGGAKFRLPASGWPGGFGNLLNLYCWSLVEDGGVLYLGSFDATTFLRVLPAPDFEALLDLTEEQLGHMVFALEQVIGLLEAHGVSEAYIEPYRRLLEALDVGDPALVDWDEVQQILYDGFAGGDLWKSEDGLYWEPVTLNGFDNPNNYGVRNLVRTNPLFAGMANPFQGAEIWRAPPTVTIVKETDPDGGIGFQFTGDLGDFTLDDDGSRVLSGLGPADYDVTEAVPPGWSLDSVVCTGGDSTAINNGVTIHLDLGEDVTCTFTNSKHGSIIVEKQTNPDGATGSFTFSGDVAGTISDDGQIVVADLPSGTYTATEGDPGPDFNLTAITCDDGNSSGDVGTRTATFKVEGSETVKCTFTNVKQGTITIMKDAVPDDAQDFDFTGDLGNFSLDDDTDPTLSSTATFQNQAPGTYSVSEGSIPAGWNLSSIVCNDPDGGTTTDLGTATANIDLDAGEGIVCTFTNIKQDTISIVKDAAPDDSQDFDFSGDLGNFSLDDDTDPTLPSTVSFQDQAPGTYSVSEASIPVGWNLSSIVCNDPDGDTTTDLGTATANIDLDAGEGIVCTFTNTQQRGTIIVEKQTDPDGAAGSFTFSGDAAGTISDGGQIVVADLLPGTYTTTEADPSPEFELTAITCDDGNSSGDVGTRTATFVLDPDETVKCTFTNTQQRGTIIVEKQTNPDGSWGSFTFSGHAAGTISDGGQIVVADLLPGTYTATEADPSPEFELTAITCDDGNSSGNVGARTATFRLDPDETVKCTFTNARRSLKVTKELELPVGGLAAVDQIVRFNITVENDGGLTIDPLTLRDDYEPWCLRSRRAEVPPDVHGGGQGFLQWNNLGALAPGQTFSLWVEFTANHACEEATNRATVETGGLTFEDEATVRILETIARVGGFIFHDDNGDGALNLPCRGTDVDPATCEPGLEEASAETTLPSGELYQYDTNTSGWYSFNLLDPGTYHVEAAPPADSWWTPTTAEECDATVVNKWDWVFCHFGYWWGLDGPPVQAASVAANETTLSPTQDATISEWAAGNQGMEEHLRVRQPGVTSALLQFDLTDLPDSAEIVWAKLRLYSPFASNGTNRLYMTAYPLDKAWVEEEVTWLQTANGSPWDEPGATGDHGDPVGWAWIDAPGWVEFDLDPAGLLASDYGFLIRGEGTDNREVAYWFFSREYVSAAVQPQLVVGYNVP